MRAAAGEQVIGNEADLGALLLSKDAPQNPYPLYSRIRTESPVYRSPALNAWLITGYREVREVYRSHEQFLSKSKGAQNFYSLPIELRREVPLVELLEATGVLGSADPPVHTRHRSSVARPLQPRRIQAKREWMEALCTELADSLADKRNPDLIRDYSAAISYRSILELFGCPVEHIALYDDVTQARQAFWSLRGADEVTARRYELALQTLRDAVESLYPKLRNDDDGKTIIGSLLHPLPSGDKLNRDEVFGILKTFFTVAHENLIYTLPVALLQLMKHPDQLEAVRRDGKLASGAFEEAVRFEPPAQANTRFVGEDITFYGHKMRKGDWILNFKSAANRDPAVWTNPDAYDLYRNQNEPEGGSVAFGQGIHFCVGAGVARLEVPIAINVLLKRFPNIRLVDGWTPVWQDEPIVRKLAALPVVLE